MKQAGRQTKRPKHSYSDLDLLANDVRRVLKRCKAPKAWGDEEGVFLCRLVVDPRFLNDSDCQVNPLLQRERAKRFSQLCVQASNVFDILNEIRKVATKRKFRKVSPSYVLRRLRLERQLSAKDEKRVRGWLRKARGEKDLSSVWQLAVRHAITSHLAAGPMGWWHQKEYQMFWNNKVEQVAAWYSENLKEQFTAKDVEKARLLIRTAKPFMVRPGTVGPRTADLKSKRSLAQYPKVFAEIKKQFEMISPD
jgi:hypothetical protein